jgi:hypothetical protein
MSDTTNNAHNFCAICTQGLPGELLLQQVLIFFAFAFLTWFPQTKKKKLFCLHLLILSLLLMLQQRLWWAQTLLPTI